MNVADVPSLAPRPAHSPARIFRILRTACCISLAVCLQPLAHAQTNPPSTNPETAFTSQLLDNRFLLRSFSAEPHIKGTWDGQTLTLNPVPWHIFAMLTVNKVKVHGNKLKIEAVRNELERDPSGKIVFDPLPTPVDLTLTLPGGPATLTPALHDALFFPTVDDALAAIPKPFRTSIPIHIGAPPHPITNHPPCDCADPSGACTGTKDTGWQRPVVTHQVEPQFSQAARNRKASGNVEIGIRLDTTGAIVDEWIIREAPFGFDTEAATAVSKYTFTPATCHNKPVESSLFVDVNFQIY